MNITNTKSSYGIITILLHWIMAIIIIGLFALGKYMHGLDYYDKWYHAAPWWHKSIGISIFFLLIIRLVWRLGNVLPEPLRTYKNWEIKMAKAVHILFYVFLVIICISGYFISTAKGVSIEVFGWFHIPAVMSYGKIQADIGGEIHEIAAHLLALFFVLHVLAAFKHHFIDKDVTLLRMLKT